MATFSELIAKLGDNAEAIEIAKSLNADFEKAVSSVSEYESKFIEAKNGRDTTKAKLREIAETLGISSDELSKDKLAEVLSKKSPDEVTKAYEAKLSGMAENLNTLKNEYEGKLSEREKAVQSLLIEKELLKQGANLNMASEKALDVLVGMLKSNAVIENGRIVYKNADGSYIRDKSGKEQTLETMLDTIRNDSANAFLFKSTIPQGGGKQPNTNGGGDKPKTFAERQKELFNKG